MIEPAPEASVVLDTNVLLDIYSCHDIYRDADKLGWDAAANAPQLIYRRDRARSGILLAIMFHHGRVATYTHGEALTQMQRAVPVDNAEFPLSFTTSFLHFVRPLILPEWTPLAPSEPEQDLSGPAFDDAFVAYAKEHGIPLISNERFGPNGMNRPKNGDIRSKAERVGVQVLTSRQYYEASGRNEARDIQWFLSRFRHEARAHIPQQPDPTASEQVLQYVSGVYRHVLNGDTEGMSEPASVRVPMPDSPTLSV